MENYLNELTESMINLCGASFVRLWSKYDQARSRPELQELLRYCLKAMNRKTKYERCTIWAFMYAVFYINDTFLWRDDRMRITCLNKIDELLLDNFVHSGEHPSIVEVLHRFKNKYGLVVHHN